VLRSSPVPRKIVTDQLRSYPAAKAEIPGCKLIGSGTAYCSTHEQRFRRCVD
jgi:hypothetical protein